MTMTHRERFAATLAGEATDRHPVWLKMTNPTWRTSQPATVRELDDAELLAACGCDLFMGNGLPVIETRPHVEHSERTEGNRTHHLWRTPDGPLAYTIDFDPATRSRHPTSYPVGTPEELARYRWYLRDTSYAVDPAAATAHAERQEELAARDAVTMFGICHSTLMELVESVCGPENTIFLQYDAPELFAEVIGLMHADRLRKLEALLPRCRADTFWLTENTSTTLISPEMFVRWSKPCLADYGRLITEHDVIPVHHMCGTLNALLEDIEELPARINEAYTTRPLGDVSLAEGRTRMPGKTLFGGTNATLWLSEPEDILAAVAADLDACPDTRRIILSSAGVLPPPVDLDKARRVVAGLKDFPVA